jgi:hypothetical protein
MPRHELDELMPDLLGTRWFPNRKANERVVAMHTADEGSPLVWRAHQHSRSNKPGT